MSCKRAGLLRLVFDIFCPCWTPTQVFHIQETVVFDMWCTFTGTCII